MDVPDKLLLHHFAEVRCPGLPLLPASCGEYDGGGRAAMVSATTRGQQQVFMGVVTTRGLEKSVYQLRLI